MKQAVLFAREDHAGNYMSVVGKIPQFKNRILNRRPFAPDAAALSSLL